MRRPNLEKIQPVDGSSFYMTYHKAPLLCHEDFWHFHPEFEIVYVPHGDGKRFVGDKMSRFSGGDLVLLGPNIPHNAFNFGFESPGYEEFVIQFKGDVVTEMADTFTEFSPVAGILARARTGIVFHGEAKHRLGAMIREMYALAGFQRLMKLFAVLWEMSLVTGCEDLAADGILSLAPGNAGRIAAVYQLIQANFHRDLSTREIARTLAMTESSFCRFFRQATGKTFKAALTEVRIRKASALLLHSDMPVAMVALQTGFNNISLFNRFFKAMMHQTPGQYRGAARVEVDAAGASWTGS
jgi:AraC-like DNA-binding protein